MRQAEGLNRKSLQDFPKFFLRKNSRGHFVPLEPFGLFKPDVRRNFLGSNKNNKALKTKTLNNVLS